MVSGPLIKHHKLYVFAYDANLPELSAKNGPENNV